MRSRRPHRSFRLGAPLAGAGLALCTAAPALASSPAAGASGPVVVSLNETLDLWRNTQGGLQVGGAQLSKLQILVDLDGAAVGRPGWSARLQYFRTSGGAPSERLVGDIQTVDNIEAVSTDRLMEAWIERHVGASGAVRLGLMDLNADFDSIGPAALFLNSSHGIAADLASSGLNGPSIFPVSSLGVHARWSPSKSVTLRAAAFDGVPGDPDHPKAFAAVKLDRRDGALLIGQADWKLAKDAQLSLGAWRYTAVFERLIEPGEPRRAQAGVYAFVAGPLPRAPDWQGWLRLGLTDPDVDFVSDYVGAGLVRTGPFAARPNDEVGLAVARAGVAAPVRRARDLPAAETTFELTYRYRVNAAFAIQPDLQYVLHPASQPGLDDAFVVGLRFSIGLSKAFASD